MSTIVDSVRYPLTSRASSISANFQFTASVRRLLFSSYISFEAVMSKMISLQSLTTIVPQFEDVSLAISRSKSSRFTSVKSISSPTFFIPPHPLSIATIPYGLFLVFAAWLDTSLIPESLPLGALAIYLGNHYNGLIGLIAVVAGLIHVLESIAALYLSAINGFTLKTSLLWWLNGLFFGIFGLWPLVFNDFFEDVKDEYCAYSPCQLNINYKRSLINHSNLY